MVTQSFALAVCIGFFLPIVAFGDPAATNLPLRAAVTLSDGSRVLGVPRIASIPFQTAYAKIDLPLKQIQSIKIESDHETVALALTNGDRLKGTLQLKPIELETLFGIVKIDFTLIAGISVYQGGKGVLPATLLDGLVLYCSFDKDEGDKVTDASGKGHDGGAKGAAWVADGIAGGACGFDGRSSYVDVGDPTDLRIVKSISAWVKSNSNGVRQTIVSKHASVNNGYSSAGYHFLKESDDKFGLCFVVNGNPNEAYSESLSTYTDSSWHHVVGVLNPETGRVDLYVDGQNVADYHTVSPGTAVGTDKRPFYIGRATWGDGGSSSSWNGSIDELRVYNRALSEDEVKALYNAQN